ncbi:alpha,alpha-trehalose-phosphate synthase [UDP-forming] 1-like [Camellia sinensis]|uniref:alpha,alpha-trehalose-phosphate synthase [UDP-forming] 1-like n=1 Tax=Camellia sinensis TaxID=4442 RepID=UPI00103622F4|nr:alpha,alpha-trehalose-phosphate synthase [UDP-forming] 1-like [Camellia sinensis]
MSPWGKRLLVVANRLPVSAVRRGTESWSLEISTGGLVSAFLGVKEFEARWIGWAGVNVPDKAGQKALTKALAEKICIPVFLDEEIVHCRKLGAFLLFWNVCLHLLLLLQLLHFEPLPLVVAKLIDSLALS